MQLRRPQPASYRRGYLFPFACFSCRKSFKRAYKQGEDKRPCPHCGADAVMLGRKFKPPARDDIKQWKKVERLYFAGFRFDRGTYPSTLAEVDGFIEKCAAAEVARCKPRRRGYSGKRHSRRKMFKD